MREHDVGGEERRVGEREADANRLAPEANVRQQVDAKDRREDCGEVSRRAGADHRQGDRPDELDRGNGRERQTVDRNVEAGVHDREDRAEREDQQLPLTVERPELAPGPAPEGEDERRRGDSQPRDAEHVDPCEEQDRERRAEVVEDRAPDEVGLRRDWLHVAELGCGGFGDEELSPAGPEMDMDDRRH